MNDRKVNKRAMLSALLLALIASAEDRRIPMKVPMEREDFDRCEEEYHHDCLTDACYDAYRYTCGECGEYRDDSPRVEAGMKCYSCAYLS